MAKADLTTPRSLRFGIVVVILVIHVAVIVGLIRAFAPDLTAAIVQNVTSAFTVTVTTPTPTPDPEPPAKADPIEEGAAAPPGKKAKPRETVAPEPKIVIAQSPAPRASSTGTDNSSGARESGEGTGAAGQGTGTGAGNSGSGQGGGGGGGTKAEKIAGDINSARDYPRAGRDSRIGDHVVIALTVGADGRAKDCRIVRQSRDPQADAITCELAVKRFRFRPATNAAGEPVDSVYGWKQRWFFSGRD